ncbi:MAG: MFS transporter, partial [Planctomycetaceae bacterium]
SQKLEQLSPTTYEQYAADSTKSFPLLPEIRGLDGGKVGQIKEKKADDLTLEDKQVVEATLYGGRMALKWTALVPAMMAVGYLILLLYFKSRGGYKAEVIHKHLDELEHPEELETPL